MKYINNSFSVEKVKIQKLANKFETPFYCYSYDKLKKDDSLYFHSLYSQGYCYLKNGKYTNAINKFKTAKKYHINKMLKSKIDLIITSGAVSAGKFDFVPSVVNSFQLSYYFKSVAIRPGKPILYAKIKSKQKVIFGLPGNPMSSSACFRFFVIPYIANTLGLNTEIPVRGILKNSFIKKKQFTRFAKSKLSTTKDGKIEIEILKGQESFRVKSFIKSNF